MPLSKMAANARASATMALNARAKELAAGGVEVVNFTIGEPDFDTPDNVKQAAHRAIQAGFTKYQPAAGSAELRAAIARKLATENGIECEPEQVLVSNGAKQALYVLMLCLVEAGDQVLIPAPYWLSYAHQA
ncbi:MAG: aminotransferase class I/II-fold pyridoxal phosphate-dependent enzyme [Planctomycetota bacterium]